MIKEEEIYRLRCEKIVNESWSQAERLKDDIVKVLEKEKPETERDISLLIIAASAFIQKVTVQEVYDQELFNVSEGSHI